MNTLKVRFHRAHWLALVPKPEFSIMTSISFIGFVPFFFPTLPAKIIHFFNRFE